MFSPSEEREDEYQKYYSQFRPRQRQHQQLYSSPAPSSYYSCRRSRDTESPQYYPRLRSRDRTDTYQETDNLSRDSGLPVILPTYYDSIEK